MQELRMSWDQVVGGPCDFETALNWYTKRAGMLRERYVNLVPMGSRAMGPSALGCFMALAEVCSPMAVYETGTGVSTIMLRNWLDRRQHIYSAHMESNKEWLLSFRFVMSAFDVEPINIYSRESFWTNHFHDERYVALIDSDYEVEDIKDFAARPNGLVFICNAHLGHIQDAAKFYMSRWGKLYGLQTVATDDYNRYPWVWVGRDFQFDVEVSQWWRIL